jgi:arylformamidase
MGRWATSAGPRLGWLAILVLGLLLTAPAGARAQEQVAYGDGRGQVADLFLAGPGSPVFVLVTGQGWIQNDPSVARRFASILQAAGITVLVPHYTLRAPEQAVADVARAVVYAAQMPGRGRLTVGGHSAGAHLVAMLALSQPRDIDGVVLMSGLYDLPGMVQDGGIAAWLVQQAFGANPGVWQSHSPVARVRGDTPTIWVVHGATDRDVSPQRASVFATRLREAGSPVALTIMPNVGHIELPATLITQRGDALVNFISTGQTP